MIYIKDFNVFITENMKYHIDNNLSIIENIFRTGSKSFFNLLRETRELFKENKIELTDLDKELFENTDIGIFGMYKNEIVPLDMPLIDDTINETEIKLNHPTRSSGPKKYKVYVKNPKTGKIKKINFGDIKGGLKTKIDDPEARKSFVARHKCHLKKDKMTAGYWACRIPKYKNLYSGTYNGYW